MLKPIGYRRKATTVDIKRLLSHSLFLNTYKSITHGADKERSLTAFIVIVVCIGEGNSEPRRLHIH